MAKQLDQKRQAFIEKTKELPPLNLGGNGHGGPVNQSESVSSAKVELEDSAAVQQVQEVKADGTTH